MSKAASSTGKRAVIEPVLGCEARGIEPPCPACARGPQGRRASASPSGTCVPACRPATAADTGGGWSGGLVAHESQLHEVPDNLSDEAAVMVEPAACAVHAACAADITGGERVIVLGAGTLGLCVIAALRALCLPGALVAVAKHPEPAQARPRARRGPGREARRAQAGRAAPFRLACPRVLRRQHRAPDGWRRPRHRLRGQRGLAGTVPRRRPPRRPDRARRHAGGGEARPRPPLAARGGASRRLRLWD